MCMCYIIMVRGNNNDVIVLNVVFDEVIGN